jgi:hypothetical protein
MRTQQLSHHDSVKECEVDPTNIMTKWCRMGLCKKDSVREFRGGSDRHNSKAVQNKKLPPDARVKWYIKDSVKNIQMLVRDESPPSDLEGDARFCGEYRWSDNQNKKAVRDKTKTNAWIVW